MENFFHASTEENYEANFKLGQGVGSQVMSNTCVSCQLKQVSILIN